MGALLIILCQAFDLGTPLEERLPEFSNLDAPIRAGGAEQHLGVDVYALYIRWDSGLRLEDSWGYGGDVKFGLEWGTPVMLCFKLGYAGWRTDNDDSKTFAAVSNVREYRAGVGADFAAKFFDFGIYANFGVIHFHSDPETDTARFFELQAVLAFRPAPHFKIGITGMVNWVGTDYNRASTHLFTNHCIGPIIEFIF